MSRPGAELLREALAALARGWALTPLRGKRPFLNGWQDRPIPNEAHVRQWLAWGHNLGLRTGPVSGVLVIDHDPRHDDGTPLPALPVTVTAKTGGGGTHRYYRCPADPPPNSAGRIHPALDVKSVGGQVVFVGSVHLFVGLEFGDRSTASVLHSLPCLALQLGPTFKVGREEPTRVCPRHSHRASAQQ